MCEASESLALSVELGRQLEGEVISIEDCLRHFLPGTSTAFIEIEDDVVHRAAVAEAGLGIELHGVHRRIRRDLLVAVGKRAARSEEHTSELQSLMRISYAVFCLKK